LKTVIDTRPERAAYSFDPYTGLFSALQARRVVPGEIPTATRRDRTPLQGEICIGDFLTQGVALGSIILAFQATHRSNHAGHTS
jgi:hypothetical protein